MTHDATEARSTRRPLLIWTGDTETNSRLQSAAFDSLGGKGFALGHSILRGLPSLDGIRPYNFNFFFLQIIGSIQLYNRSSIKKQQQSVTGIEAYLYC